MFKLNKKKILARINYRDHTVNVRSVSERRDKPVKISVQDIASLRALLSSLDPGPSIVDDALISTLNFLSAHPPDEFVDVNTEGRPRPQAYSSICKSIGSVITGTYTVGTTTYTVQTQCGPCGSGGCSRSSSREPHEEHEEREG